MWNIGIKFAWVRVLSLPNLARVIDLHLHFILMASVLCPIPFHVNEIKYFKPTLHFAG